MADLSVRVHNGASLLCGFDLLPILQDLPHRSRTSGPTSLDLSRDHLKIHSVETANMVAHMLARSDFPFLDVSSNSYVWLEDYPSIICNVLRSDCSCSMKWSSDPEAKWSSGNGWKVVRATEELEVTTREERLIAWTFFS
ncbi:uncharacterized protein G2W53_013968 [Senna tora]|uniref:Uncharacterized protein n=1 Tax=Senna tora TaxID=362788 RepID=A0A834WPV8_9FABA|nr:uncharacterized protein G2W53_013968 [Senna tora]